MVNALLRNGANANCTNASGITPLMLAAGRGHVDIVRTLIDEGAVTHTTLEQEGNTHSPLIWAAHRGHLDVVKLLLDRGVYANLGNAERTPLMAAALGGHPAVVRLLLRNGADVRAHNSGGGTALAQCHLCFQNQAEIIRLLLMAGADAEARWCGTPLLISLADSNAPTESIRLVLEHGADINAKDNRGETALMKAAQWAGGGYPFRNGKLLLQHGADQTILDHQGHDARWHYHNPPAAYTQVYDDKKVRAQISREFLNEPDYEYKTLGLPHAL